MKHRRRHWPQVLIVSLVVLAILGMAPATLLARWVEDACSGQCRLAKARGFWWSGEARLFIRPASNAPWMALGPITWWPAIDASAPLQVRLGTGEISLRPGWQGLRVDMRNLTLPANALLAHPALHLPAARWEGTLTLTQAWFALGRAGAFDSAGRLLWRGASSKLLENLPLGDLEFNWRKADQEGPWLARIGGGRPGHLSLAGDIRYDGAGARHVDLRLELAPSSQPTLGKYLSLAGAEAGPATGQHVLRRTF